jgi:hypothetical protein
VENLIYLCSNHHRSFDASFPDLVIIPTDCKFFISWEKKDYKNRCRVAKNGGEPPPRTVPSSEYTGKFKAYVLKGTTPQGMVFQEKAWGGSPTAMIFKACMVLLQPIIPIPSDGDIITSPRRLQANASRVRSNYLPQGTRLFAKLIDLYSRPAPTADVSCGSV